jgi:hypothetical protein
MTARELAETELRQNAQRSNRQIGEMIGVDHKVVRHARA